MPYKQSGRPIDISKDKAILEAARELLLTSGPAAVTMEGVAAKAKISKGTLYSRYSNRHDLLCEVARSRATDLTLPIEKPPKSLVELNLCLVKFIEKLTRYMVSPDHIKLMEVMATPSDVMRIEKKNIYQSGPQQTHNTLANYLKTAAQSGLIQCESPEDSAELLLGMMMGLDLVRAWYGIPLKLAQSNDKQQALSVVNAFLKLHVA